MALLLTGGLVFAACQNASTVTLGDPTSAEFLDVTLGAVNQRLSDHIGLTVRLEGKFKNLLWQEFSSEGDSFLATGEFGDFVVVFPPGKYTELVGTLRPGQPVQLFGYISTVTPPGRKKALVAIVVN
ncbi:MAG: hypothetical protein M5R36_11095 [Deltaproteobacteria bacterium]|nr:hypothetical protein [Deltaproteobacteria bacterium]